MTPALLLQTNLKALERQNSALASILGNHVVAKERFAIEQTKEDNTTVQCRYFNGDRPAQTYLHSRYYPTREAARFADAQYKAGPIVLYGFGLGYHVHSLLERMDSNQNLTVFETNLDTLRLAFENINLAKVLASSQVELKYFADISECVSSVKNIVSKSGNMVVHSPSVSCLGDSFLELKLQLTNVLFRGDYEHRQEFARQNHAANLKIDSSRISNLFGKHLGATFLLVSSGPSLRISLDWLSSLQERGEKCVIICVGSALRALVEHQIVPDYVVFLDALPAVHRQLLGCESVRSPMLFSNFTNASVVQAHSGPKYMYFGEHLPGVEPSDVIPLGGSVANAAMSIALKMGASRVVFLGQDLCFPGNVHHVKTGKSGETDIVKDLKNMVRVKNVNGEYVSSQINMLNYRKWFEETIQVHQHVTFLNLADEGLPIVGASQINLEQLKQIITGLP